MRSQKLVRKYCQGLVNALQDDREYESVYREIQEFESILDTQRKLKDVLVGPFLPLSKKNEIFREILQGKKVQKKTLRFLWLLIEHGRLEILEDILSAVPEAWNEKKGVSSFEVRSVIPLNEAQKRRLSEKLESMEKKPVVLTYAIDADLIGGLWIRKGNIVYDASLRGNLNGLKETISEG